MKVDEEIVKKCSSNGLSTRLWKKVRKGGRVSCKPSKAVKNNGVKRRVKTLKRLIPNSEKSIGLDGLFEDTADYILCLQIKVRLMQTMVDLLSAGSDE